MGQRTQIAVVIEDNINKTNTLKVYHDQWGIGRRMYLILMNLANKYYFNSSQYEPRTFTETFGIDKSDANDISHEWTKTITSDEVRRLLTPEGANDLVFSHCDNNNGGLVVHAVINDWSHRDSNLLEFGFLLGSENECCEYDGREFNSESKAFGKAFSRWLTAEEFASLSCNREFTDAKFIKMFKQFIKYFEIGQLKNQVTVEAH